MPYVYINIEKRYRGYFKTEVAGDSICRICLAVPFGSLREAVKVICAVRAYERLRDFCGESDVSPEDIVTIERPQSHLFRLRGREPFLIRGRPGLH